MKSSFSIIFLFSILLNMDLMAQVPVGQRQFEGSYTAKGIENDTVLNETVPVFLKLVLNPDSTFSFFKRSEKGHCDSNRAGFWSTGDNSVWLDFIGESQLELRVNEGHNYLSLINKKEELYLVKQKAAQAPPGQQGQYRPPKRKFKDPKCPTF